MYNWYCTTDFYAVPLPRQSVSWRAHRSRKEYAVLAEILICRRGRRTLLNAVFTARLENVFMEREGSENFRDGERLEQYLCIWRSQNMYERAYHWTLLRRGLRAAVPSIILCVIMRDRRAPQRRGSPHSGEGKNGRSHLITAEWRGYEKIPVVGFQDIYKPDLQNSFQVDRSNLRGVSHVVTQIPSGT